MKIKLMCLALGSAIIFASCESNEYSTEDVDTTSMIVPGVSVDSGEHKVNTAQDPANDTTTADTGATLKQ